MTLAARLRAALAAIALLASPPAFAAPAAPLVRVEGGVLRGDVTDGVESWKAIPFAAPPVGPLRWRAPQPAPAWPGVRDASAYGHDCMQKPFPSDAAPLGTEPAEDCLYANVWRPAGARTGLPVLVWIYGGGFVNGGASPPTYAGANLARQGILVFSFNYRLGRFGTFAFPQLTRQDPDHGRLANYGLMDQIAALQWVQRNIGAFGGDPARVTVMGESAGGMSVHALLTSPQAQSMFAQAVILSGGDGRSHPDTTLAQAEQVGVAFARAHAIDPQAPDALDALRALPAEAVVDGLNLAWRKPPGPPTYASPFPDGQVMVDVGEAYAQGRFAHAPVIVGATSADIGGRSGFMIAGARQVAASLAEAGVPVWDYRFSYVADSVRAPGAPHASDIPFFFDTVAIKYGAAATPKDVAVGHIMSRYLVDFVKTGDPDGPGLPPWPRYASAKDEIMDFAADGRAEPQRDPWTAPTPRP